MKRKTFNLSVAPHPRYTSPVTPTLLAESTSERRLIGRLDAGSDIIEGLAELCDTQEIFAGEIRALGVLKTIEISELDPETGRYRVLAKIAGPITLVHAYGNIAELGGSPVVALRGVFSWNDSRSYDGQYVKDQKEGVGVFKWPDGRRYEGQWRNGKQHGHGVYTAATGESREGEWEEGRRTRWVGNEGQVEKD